MEDPKVIKAISKWFHSKFTIDRNQELNLLCPKPMINNLAANHDFGIATFTELGFKRCVDTILKEIITEALREQPSKNIDTVANYTLRNSQSPDRVRKIRCYRFIFPKPSTIISPEDRSDYAKFFELADQTGQSLSPTPTIQTSSVPPSTNQSNCSTDISSSTQHQIDTINGTNGEDMIVIELFAGEATAIQQMYHSYPDRTVKSIAIDKLPPETCGASRILRNRHSHFHQANLRYVSSDDVMVWCTHILNTSPDKINRIHASVPCQTYVIIDQCNSSPHRDREGKALSDQARAHDELLRNVISIIKYVISKNPSVCITIENPAHGFFHKQTSIVNLLNQPGWQGFIMDHCAAANPVIDGKVHGPAFNRKGGLFSKKPTFWLSYNINPPHPLPRCLGKECRMVVPGHEHHVLIVANHTGKPRYGQRTMESSAKSRIPLGAHLTLWNAHQAWLQTNIDHHTECAVCGSETGNMLKCTCIKCKRVQHTECSIAPRSSPWLCNTCHILKGQCNH